MMMNKLWRLSASFFCLALMFPALANQVVPEPAQAATAAVITPAGLTPFTAKYQVLRSGKVHGDAERYLKPWGQGFELGYKSNISWLIFCKHCCGILLDVISFGLLEICFCVFQ